MTPASAVSVDQRLTTLSHPGRRTRVRRGSVEKHEKEWRIMTTKITVIYDNPQDPAAFEAGYPEQVTLAKKLPGLQKIESAKVWPKEDGSAAPAYRLLDMYFTDYDTASQATATPEAGAFFPSVLELGTGGVRVVFTDLETS
jgi:uncharacterized protein (TIGR02118 family)